MSHRALVLAAIGFACLSTPAAVAGPDWVEEVDAGSQINSAQVIVNVGTGNVLSRIRGRLTGAATAAGATDDFEDMYQILITQPSKLVISTLDTETNFQSSLWLFDSAGFGLMANIVGLTPVAGVEPQGSLLLPFTTDDTGVVIDKPGIYYVCISSANRFAISASKSGGGPIFNFDTPTEISGPDGLGGGLPLVAWGGDGEGGDYEILLTGVGFIPAPGVLPMLALGLLGVSRRRR